jgi:hypothetical protein
MTYNIISFPQSKAYASQDGVLTAAMIDDIVEEAVRGHHKKMLWQEEQEKAAVSGRHSSAKDASTFSPPPIKMAS